MYIESGHYEALGVELLESLSRIAPSEEEEKKLKSYSDVKLAPPERFLQELLNVPFVFKRADALLSVATFGSKIQHLKQSFSVIQVYNKAELKKRQVHVVRKLMSI